MLDWNPNGHRVLPFLHGLRAAPGSRGCRTLNEHALLKSSIPGFQRTDLFSALNLLVKDAKTLIRPSSDGSFPQLHKSQPHEEES